MREPTGFRGTKGEWYADLGEAYRVRDGNGGSLATVSFLGHGRRFGGRRPDPEPAANATLFAASKDLLAALQETQRLLADLTRPNGDACPLEIATTWARCVEAETAARAAIAKALQQEGEKP